MEANEWIVFFLSVFVFANVLLLGLLFFTIKSANKKANRYIGLFLWSIALQIFNYLLGEIVEESGYFLLIFDPLLFALPLLFFYLYTTINKRIEKWHYLLFVPGIVHNVLLHLEGVLLTEEGITVFGVFFYCMEFLLMIYAFRILQKHKKKIVNFYSDVEYKSLAWLESIFILVVLIHLFSFTDSIVDVFTFEYLNHLLDWTFFGLLMFMIFWVSYNGFSQPEIFKQQLFLATENRTMVELTNWKEVPVNTSEKKRKKSDENKATIEQQEPIISEHDQKQFEAIKIQILQQELFTNPKLNLRSLAIKLGVKEKELSRLINECGNVNFYRFINEYRIEKFKQLVQSPEAPKFTLLGLATEAGFYSKSTFYAAFKKLEGMTPKQYEKSLKKS